MVHGRNRLGRTLKAWIDHLIETAWAASRPALFQQHYEIRPYTSKRELQNGNSGFFWLSRFRCLQPDVTSTTQVALPSRRRIQL
jgi:hypothetical protein